MSSCGVTVLYDNADEYTAGAASFDAGEIYGIEISWISGNVNIEMYDGDTVEVFESLDDSEDDSIKLRHRLVGGLLKIQFARAGNIKLGTRVKNLTVKIPRTLQLLDLELELVSASATLSNINTNSFDVETVSGNVSASFSFAPNELDIESVSGNVELYIPNPNFTLEFESLTGRLDRNITLNGKGNKYTCGTGENKYSFESTSGNLFIGQK